MSWLQVRIKLAEMQAETVAQALLEMGALAIEYSDAGDNPIFEPDPGCTPLWDKTQISALFDGGISQTAIQLVVAKSIVPTPIPQIHFALLDDRNWVKEWQRKLSPMQFGEHLWICPPGHLCPDARATVVTMEPGLGFGTGAHATTRLCLEWLSRQTLRGKTILDFGCGSGILGIAGLLLGASQVTAVDIDEHALTATRDNARQNGCLPQLRILSANCLDPITGFDVIVANILSRTLIELEPKLRAYSHSGADIVLSGILTSQAGEVASAYEKWVNLRRLAEQDDWVILTGKVN